MGSGSSDSQTDQLIEDSGQITSSAGKELRNGSMVKDIRVAGITVKKTVMDNCTSRMVAITKVPLPTTNYMEKESIPGIAKSYIKEVGSTTK